MKTAEIKAPTRIETCCFHGVAPTRKPVLRSCEVVPPLDEAMQTTPAIESAVRRYSGPIQPSRTKIRQVRSSVAIVIPEIGLDDEPITPVIRELTVTNRNPKRTIMPAPINRPVNSVGIRCEAAIASTSPSEPARTSGMGRSRSVRATPPLAGLLARAQVAQAAGHRGHDQRQGVEHAQDAAGGHRAGADVADVLAGDRAGAQLGDRLLARRQECPAVRRRSRRSSAPGRAPSGCRRRP